MHRIDGRDDAVEAQQVRDGLGFARKNQKVDMFEIDPMVVRIAENPAMFRYLSECPGTHEIFLGDGRIRMSQRPDARYGAIILDAFSSDSIPSHMVTSEAIRLYFDKLAPHGVVLFNTTNRHLNLGPLLAGQAEQLHMVAYGKAFSGYKEPLHYENHWVAIARDPSDLAPLVAREGGWKLLSPIEGTKPWTDDYVNILPYLKMLHPQND
jgi:spermidine synthase